MNGLKYTSLSIYSAQNWTNPFASNPAPLNDLAFLRNSETYAMAKRFRQTFFPLFEVPYNGFSFQLETYNSVRVGRTATAFLFGLTEGMQYEFGLNAVGQGNVGISDFLPFCILLSL